MGQATGGARASSPLGELIRRERDRRSLNRRELAGLVRRADRSLRTDSKTVERWELRGQEPDTVALRALATVFDVPVVELTRLSRRGQATDILACEEAAETKRRTFLGLIAATAFDTDHLAAALGAPRVADHRLLENLEAQAHEYGRMYWAMSPASFWPTVYGYFAVTRQIHLTAPSSLKLHAGVVASRAAALLGMLADRLHRRADAVMYLHLADELADEAGDGPLRAHALVALRAVYSPVTSGAGRTDAMRAVRLLDEAVGAAGSNTASMLLTWLHACRAEDHAFLGDGMEAVRNLELAELALANAAVQPAGFFHHWNTGRLAGFRGNCHVLLGQPDDAIAVLHTVARETSRDLIGPYTAVLADLAAAHALRGDVEHACSILSGVLTTAERANAPERAARVWRVRGTHLTRWLDAPAIRQLDAQLERFTIARE